MTIQTLKNKILPTLKRQGVVKAGVFGSFVRDEAKEESDIDILVEFGKKQKMGLFEFVGLKLKLEERLGKKVDLVEYSTIRPFLKDIILKEQVPIL